MQLVADSQGFIKGFVLLELLVAIALLSVALVALLQAQFVAHHLNARLGTEESADTEALASCSISQASPPIFTCMYGKIPHWFQGD